MATATMPPKRQSTPSRQSQPSQPATSRTKKLPPRIRHKVVTPTPLPPPTSHGHSRNGTYSPPDETIKPLPEIAIQRSANDGRTMSKEHADRLVQFLTERFMDENPESPLGDLLTEHGLIQSIPQKPARPDPVPKAFPASAVPANNPAYSVHSSVNGTYPSHGVPIHHATSPETYAPRPTSTAPASRPMPGTISTVTPDVRRGVAVLTDCSTAERILEIAGVPSIVTNEGARAYLHRVRSSADDATDPIEQMHLDLAASSYQLTLKYQASAARNDVSPEVAVAYAGAATQLQESFTSVTGSLTIYRHSRRKSQATAKQTT